MTYKDVKTLLDTTDLPVVYYQWPDGKAPDPPYIVFFFPGDNDFVGDNCNYQKIRELTVELYTDQKDFALEETVEAVLSDLVYSRYETYIDSERMYQVVYETEVLITEEEEENVES